MNNELPGWLVKMAEDISSYEGIILDLDESIPASWYYHSSNANPLDGALDWTSLTNDIRDYIARGGM